MSNRPNDPDDDFRDFMGDDDDFGGGDDDLTFDEFDREDNDLDNIDFGDEDDAGTGDFDDTSAGTGNGGGGGPSRTFIIIAGILIIVLLLGFGLLAYAILGPKDNPLDATRTAIAETNNAVAFLLTSTSDAGTAQFIGTSTVQAQFDSATGTAFAVQATQTIEAQNSFATQTIDAQNAFATQTQQAQGAGATGTALALTAVSDSLTQTSIALTATSGGQIPPSLTPTTGGISGGPGAIQQTATALRSALLTQTAQAGTPVTPQGGANVTPRATPTSLEDAGFIDDLGSGGPGTLLMMGLALVGVIFLSRGLRTVNSNR